MTMMKKKMAMDLASATATLKPETRMENMKMGHMRGVVDYRGWTTGFRLLQRSATQCPIYSIYQYHRTQEAKEKAKVKKRGLYDSPAAGEKVRAGRKSYLPSILHIHDQVTYNKLCPRCVYPATVLWAMGSSPR
jgi:hypothetical protein